MPLFGAASSIRLSTVQEQSRLKAGGRRVPGDPECTSNLLPTERSADTGRLDSSIQANSSDARNTASGMICVTRPFLVAS
jgi:hypothetical protein